MNVISESLFLHHIDPMWVYDRSTLRFLAVNNSAIAKYGYSEAEFLAMTIADIRPVDDLDALKKNVGSLTEGRDEAGVWRHCLKSGELIYVDITGYTIDHDGRAAELISARDVSRLVRAEKAATDALSREQAARRSSDSLAAQFQIMFDSVPGIYLVFSSVTFDIAAVSADYIARFGGKRTEIVGQSIFDVLPLDSEDIVGAKLRNSVDLVVASHSPDVLDILSFRLPRATPQGEETSFWATTMTPVMGPDGRLLHLMLRMQDVTEAIVANEAMPPPPNTGAFEPARRNMIAHARELRSDNMRLTELATKLRATQRLLETGTWEYVIAEDRLTWSDNVYAMYGVTPDNFAHRLEDYIALIHPDEREMIRAEISRFLASDEVQFAFAHQVLRPDGKIIHVQCAAERIDSPKGPLLSGAVQNVTETLQASRDLARANRLLEIAGTAAKFGAWRYEALTKKLEWSDQTARIHDEPEGFAPTMEAAFDYYAPEYRQKIKADFDACVDKGQSFDEIFEIISAKGQRRWVRVTGEAEYDLAGDMCAVHGSFQDISELVAVRIRAEDSEKLLEIAGRAVKLGGWRVSLPDGKVTWTDAVALIHELPQGSTVTFEGGIDYFAPEEREDAQQAFVSCAKDGIAFDNIRYIVTAKGNRVKVRSLGVPVRDSSGKIIAVQGAMQDISELTAAQNKADELRNQLAETLENIGDAFFTLDRDWKFSYLNGRAELLLEKLRDQLVGRYIFEAFPEAIGTEFDIQYRRAIETGETVRFEQYFPPLLRTFRVNAHPTPSGLAVYFSDVSEERHREEQLRLLNAAVARLNDIVIITEAVTSENRNQPRIVYVNDAFERVTGFTREQALGQTPRLLQGPKTQRGELDRIKAALENRSPVRAELINYSKSGQEYWLEIDIVPVANDTGLITHFVAIERDITARRRADQDLKLSEARFRLIARATGNAIWEWDVSGGQEWWSDGVAEIFGHEVSAASTREVWTKNVHPDEIERVVQGRSRLLSGEADSMHEVYKLRRADGSWATVEDRAFAIHDDSGQTIRVLGSIADISERHHLEESLRQSQKLEAVGHLTGGVAHDFNNLLTIIIGNTEFLQDALPPSNPLRHFVDMSALAADRAAELTSRLLAFSRKQPLQPSVIDLNATIAGVEAMLSRTLGEDITISFAPTKDLWQAEVDLGQFETALLNLAVNSRDAMPNGGTLTIETANVMLDHSDMEPEPGLHPGPYILVAVNDTGEGIPPDQINRVFEPYFTTKPVGKGTGLGLSMVYGFVKQTGGYIRLHSTPNEGTTVKLYFPRFSSDPAASVCEPPLIATKRGKELILVVEDDELILQQLERQLLDLGYRVVSAQDGRTAINILQARTDIDLLFTDIVLPGGMNGRQIADEAQKLQPNLRVLFTSGYSQDAIISDGRVNDGVELLSKPYRRSDVAAKVRKVLDC
jgi:PAS domain S-box-containing protein